MSADQSADTTDPFDAFGLVDLFLIAVHANTDTATFERILSDYETAAGRWHEQLAACGHAHDSTLSARLRDAEDRPDSESVTDPETIRELLGLTDADHAADVPSGLDPAVLEEVWDGA